MTRNDIASWCGATIIIIGLIYTGYLAWKNTPAMKMLCIGFSFLVIGILIAYAIANATVLPLNPTDRAKLPLCPVCPCNQPNCKVPQIGACIGQVLICPTSTATATPK